MYNYSAIGQTLTDFAIWKTMTDIGKTVGAFIDYMNDEDMVTSGVDRGKSKLARESKKLFLPGSFKDISLTEIPKLGFKRSMEGQFRESPFDDYYKSDFKKLYARHKVLRIKAEEAMLAEGKYDIKIIRKILNRSMPYPKKPKKFPVKPGK